MEKDKINFNLTSDMASVLLEYYELKKEKECCTDLEQIKKIDMKLNKLRKLFIKEFRLSNKKEIEEYLGKDQN